MQTLTEPSRNNIQENTRLYKSTKIGTNESKWIYSTCSMLMKIWINVQSRSYHYLLIFCELCSTLISKVFFFIIFSGRYWIFGISYKYIYILACELIWTHYSLDEIWVNMHLKLKFVYLFPRDFFLIFYLMLYSIYNSTLYKVKIILSV